MSTGREITTSDADYLQILIHGTSAFELLRTALEFEIWSLERNTELLRKCHAALSEGGVCLVCDFVSNDEGTGSMSAGLVSPYFLTLASGEGVTYSADDMEAAQARLGGRTDVCVAVATGSTRAVR